MDLPLGDDERLWADLMAFSSPVDVPRQLSEAQIEALAADETLDADMAAFSPPLGVKVRHLSGDAARWTLDGPVDTAVYAETTSEKLQGDQVVSLGAAPASEYASEFTAVPKMLWMQQDAVQTALPTARPPALASLTWGNPTPTLLQVDANQLPNAGAMEIRRLKNRECMRRARQRQRDELKRMKETAERLEKQYEALCLRNESGCGIKSEPSSPSSPFSVISVQRREAQQQAEMMYFKAAEVAKQLGAENMFLRAAIQDKSAWKQHLHHIFETMPGFALSGGMHAESPLGLPQNMPMGMGRLPLNTMDPDTARSIFGFLPLTEADVTALILDNSHQMHTIRTQLESLQHTSDSHLSARQVFGWDVVQRVTQSGVMEFMFTKRFSGLSASDIMHGTWANDMELEKFRKVKCDVKRLEVLQEANANAYILGRDVRAPDNSTVFRSVFLRYLIETTQTLPNPRNKQCTQLGSGSESEEKDAPVLKASGFILGTQSVNRDWSQPGDVLFNVPMLPGVGPTGFDDHEKLVWADLALSIEFLDVEDPETGETYQRVRWMGRTDYKDSADALRNATDTLTGCLRWELLMISPALNLVSLQL
jgi:hypothetical protein